MMGNLDSDSLSTGQAAKLLNVTPDTVLKWIKKGRIPAGQTAGGHYRIEREHVENLARNLGSQPSVSQPGELMYCWEFYSEGGKVGEQCLECVVFRARALHCYEMTDLPPGSGFAGTYCKTSCEDCAYFQEVLSKPKRVLVVTDSVGLRDRLAAERTRSRLEVEFASCEYECSAAIDRLKPEFVVIDCSFQADRCRELCRHLATDPRVPGVQIILASKEEGGRDETTDDSVRMLPRTFTLEDLERRIARVRT